MGELGGRKMTTKGNIEGEWSLGSHKLLKDLVAKMKAEEEKHIKTDVENVGNPDILVVDMRTGSTVRVHGHFVRKEDYVQEIRMKRPGKMVEALLLKVISQMAGGKSALKEVMENISNSMEHVGFSGNREEIYQKWIEDYEDSIEELNAILNHFMGTTLTECAGQTRIAGEIIPKNVLGLVSTEALEAFARAMVEKESIQ
tara:strand:- start:21198 stop:21797 length:600 start_codon:yes stop_codon:yes gene_type:complete